MRALVMHEQGVMTYEEVSDPQCAPNEVVVQAEAAAICGSDIQGYGSGSPRRLIPVRMGHEAAGTVISTGHEVTTVAPGDRVALQSLVQCGVCPACKSGRANLCTKREVIGVHCDTFQRDGAFAQKIALPAHCVHKIPDGLSFLKAALIEPLAIAYHGVHLVGDLNPDAWYLVLGAGAIGQFAVQAIRSLGCKNIICVDRHATKLAAAQKGGAAIALDSSKADVAAEIMEATHHAGVYVVIDTFCGAYSMALSERVLCTGGKIVVIGAQGEASLPRRLIGDELTILGSSNATPEDYVQCLALIASGKIDPSIVISHVAPLAEGDQWFRRLYSKEEGLDKVVLLPDAK